MRLSKKKLTSGGGPKIGKPPKRAGVSSPRVGMHQPPPCLGTWDEIKEKGVKKKKEAQNNKKRTRNTIRKKQPVQQYTNPRSVIVKRHKPKPKLFKNIAMSNNALLEWCKYLNIPLNNVLSRDDNVPHNHKQALFIYNLEPSYMSGSHWVATYVKNIINYFDSFGMPPFQEMVNHATNKEFNTFASRKSETKYQNHYT